jgi:DNA-binding CsgD family transcriptional regulator
VTRLAARVLGGPVEPGVVRTVTSSVGHAPAAVVDVVRASARSGALRRNGSVWRQVGSLGVPPTLVARVEHALAGIDEAGREGIDLIAVARSVPQAIAVDVVGAETLEALERAGIVEWIVSDGCGARAALTHPAVRTVRLARLSPVRAARLAGQLRVAIERRGATHPGQVRTPDDRALDAALALQHGEPWDATDALTAARAAREVGDIALAEAVCRAALRDHDDIPVAIELGELLIALGRNVEADELLAALAPDDPADRALVVMARAVNLAYHLDRVDDATSLLTDALRTSVDGDWEAELQGLIGVFELVRGRTVEAVRIAEPHLGDGAGRHFVEAATAAGPALVMMGRSVEAADLAQRSLDARLALGEQPVLADPGLHALIRSLALTEAGRLDEAVELGRFVESTAIEIDSRQGQMWAGVIVGRALLLQGHFGAARRSFELAAAAATDLNMVLQLRWARGGALLAAAHISDLDDVRHAADALDACPPTELGLMASEIHRARAWAAIARGDRRGGAELLRAAADLAADTRQPGLEVIPLHDLVRIGLVDDTDRLERVAATVQGELARWRSAHGRSLAAGAADGLVEVAEHFERLGAIVLAAEAANQAAWAARRVGMSSLADVARSRMVRLLAQRPEAGTPSLAPHPGFGLLTDREREVAELAARGDASKAIAARLGVSVRTVDNLLQRVYRKLGIRGRDDLRALRHGGSAAVSAVGRD